MREDYTRVTSVLYPFTDLDKIPPNILKNAADRGTKVHEICEGIISGIGEHGVDEETRGYVDSFIQWWSKGHKVVEMEKRFWCDDLKITGQCDLIIDTGDGLAIVDLKTSSKESDTWHPQGCAYAYLARQAGYDIQKIMFIHLFKDGREAKVIEYPVDIGFFFAIFKTYLHFYHKD